MHRLVEHLYGKVPDPEGINSGIEKTTKAVSEVLTIS